MAKKQTQEQTEEQAQKEKELRMLTVLAQALDSGPGDEVCHALDEVVIDVKLEEADEITGAGYHVQLEFLVKQGAGTRAKEALTSLAKELKESAGKEGE